MTAAAFKPTEPHPVLQLPTPEQVVALGAERWREAMALREKAISEEVLKPLWRCYEPPIWKVCDALWGAPWLDEKEADAIRRNLGFLKPVNVLYLLGGQRSSKTEYAANRMSRLAQMKEHGLSWMFHNTLNASIDTHQKLIWKYLPPNLRGKPILSQTTYVAYKDKTGFSDGSLVLPNVHKMRFLSYDMALEDLQGFNCDAVAFDEFATPEHIETGKARVAVKNGVVFVMLAPITGYTALVQSASDGAEIIRESIAYMSPIDGGPKDISRYLGLTEAEAAALRGYLDRKQKPPFPNVPWCRPEDCSKWLTGELGQIAPEPGRKFKKIARIQRPADLESKSAIVHFHGSDNPYGNPLSLVMLNASASEEQSNRIFYGVAKEGMKQMFPKFDEKVHVIDDADIPTFGTIYQWEDPAGDRNSFLTWIRVTEKAAYVIREWPGNYEIPGLGVPGPWALPHGKLGDGAKGPGQDSFGFGLIQQKMEIARLEGWKDAQKSKPDDLTQEEWVKTWFAENGAREIVARRFIDSRFASTPHKENDRPVTLLENYADIGLFYELTPGDDVSEGVRLLNDRFSYDTTKPVDARNCPKLFIARSCKNTIFALKTWRNKEGRKGATKDPIDNLRYFVLQGVEYAPPENYESEGGGHY